MKRKITPSTIQSIHFNPTQYQEEYTHYTSYIKLMHKQIM